MRKLGMLVLMGSMAFWTASTQAQSLSVSVQEKTMDGSDGPTSIQVNPGQVVEYQVKGVLSSSPSHMGLALVGFNLNYSGGDLAQANTPQTPPDGTCARAMAHFVKNWGITNPAGYGGTIIDGNLVQVGGGQNTIKNVDSADFPTGTVRTGVAQPVANGGCGPAVLVTGQLTIPSNATDGQVFTLTLTDLFANVISPSQTGNEEFWATQAASTGTNTPLTMTAVVDSEPDNAVMARFPGEGGTLWRSSNQWLRFTFESPVAAAPGPGDLVIRELLPEGQFGPNLAGSFSFTIDGNNLIIVDTGNAMENRTWYQIANQGTWPGVADFNFQYLVQAGDANNDGIASFTDLGAINSSVPTPPALINDTNRRRDINGDGLISFADLGAANAFIPGGPVFKPSGH